MTSSSSPTVERGLDTMLLVYSFLQGHPAALPCQQFLSAYSGWFTTPLVLFEAKNILTKGLQRKIRGRHQETPAICRRPCPLA
jgi:predicted nucleic acid-binding protein